MRIPYTNVFIFLKCYKIRNSTIDAETISTIDTETISTINTETISTIDTETISTIVTETISTIDTETNVQSSSTNFISAKKVERYFDLG